MELGVLAPRDGDVRRSALVAALAALAVLAGCSSTAPPAARSPTAPAARRALRVVGLGDSVMAGTNCGCAGITREYAAALARRTNRRVTSSNLAANGLVTGDVLQDLLGSAAHRRVVRRADVVLVTIGANDLLPQFARWQVATCDEGCYRTPAIRMGSTLSRVLDVLDGLRSHRTVPVLVTDYWNVFTDGDVARSAGGQAQVDWSEDVTRAADTQICRAAREHHDRCVDLVRPFKGAFSGSGQNDPTPLLAADGDHPNAAGVGVIVQALMASTPSLP